MKAQREREEQNTTHGQIKKQTNKRFSKFSGGGLCLKVNHLPTNLYVKYVTVCLYIQTEIQNKEQERLTIQSKCLFYYTKTREEKALVGFEYKTPNDTLVKLK